MSIVPHPLYGVQNGGAMAMARTHPTTENSSALVPIIPDPELLNALLIFYQQRRGWVQRSRASLELAFVQGPLLVAPSIGGPSDSQSDSDGSAPSVCDSENTSNEPTPSTTDSERGMSSEELLIKQEEEDEEGLPARSRALVPLTLRATNAAQAPSSRWLKRKKSFKLHLGPLAAQNPMRPRRRPHGDGPEPSAQLLELFGDLLDSRMESCIRVNRLVRESNRSMLRSW